MRIVYPVQPICGMGEEVDTLSHFCHTRCDNAHVPTIFKVGHCDRSCSVLSAVAISSWKAFSKNGVSPNDIPMDWLKGYPREYLDIAGRIACCCPSPR